MPRAAIAVLVASIALMLWPSSEALARSSFGVQLNLQLGVPLSSYADSVTILEPVTLETGEVQLPYIANLTHGGSAGVGIMLIFRNVELVADISALPWKEAILRYEGDRAAQASNPTQVNDAGVTYSSLSPEVGTDPPDSLTSPLVITTVGGSYRVYMNEGFIEPYFPIGGGLSWATLSPSIPSRFGLQMWGGAGVDFVIENLTFALDMRYQVMVTNSAFGIQQGANNAPITGDGVFSSLTSTLHWMTLKAGVRYSFN